MAVKSYWHQKFLIDSKKYTSIKCLKIEFLNVGVCHPIYSSCGSSPHETMKACIQGRLLSGRYRFQRLKRHFNSEESLGLCILPSCISPESQHIEDIDSFFISCKSLKPARDSFENFKKAYFDSFPLLKDIVDDCLSICPTSFYLDCSTMSPVIVARQSYGIVVQNQLFRLCRHFCFLLHDLRTKLLSIST